MFSRVKAALAELIALEPVRVRAVASALIGLALAFGVDLDEDGILGAIDAILPYAGMILTFLTARRVVYPAAKVNAAGFTRNA